MDILIVGAGPTGMTLANELHLAGAKALLVDRLEHRSELSKAGGLQSRTLEILDQRGLLEPFDGYPERSTQFLGVQLPLVPGRPAWRSIPQVDFERVLSDRLLGDGVEIQRGRELTGIDQDADGVTATFRDGGEMRARYVVAADGAHSTVRRLLGAAFPGRAPTSTLIAADVRFDGDVPEQSHNWGADGLFAATFPLGTDGRGRPVRRLVLGGGPGAAPARDVPVTEDKIRDGLRRVFGDRLRLAELIYARRITDAARQAERYRHGRIFLAGDAAHVHLPIGAQGMNTGVQDAANLGWKLAAAVQDRAPDGLLDTYHDERHPVGAAVLRTVQAQSLLMNWAGTPDPDVAAARSLVDDLAELPAVRDHLAALLSGFAVRYPMPGVADHPLLGRAVPDLPLGGVRLFELLRTGRGLLLDPGDAYGDLVPPHVDRVRAGTEALLIRPDGYVCWAGDPIGLGGALRRWF